MSPLASQIDHHAQHVLKYEDRALHDKVVEIVPIAALKEKAKARTSPGLLLFFLLDNSSKRDFLNWK